MVRSRGTRLKLTLLAGFATAALVYLLSPFMFVMIAQRSIAGASDAAAETAALCQVNRWVHAGRVPPYSVKTRDAQGNEIRPWQDGDYDRVAVVILEWPSGQTVERALLTRDGLDCVFGE